MVKAIGLEEISIEEDHKISKEKNKFLMGCAKRMLEAVRIWVEKDPEFDPKLGKSKEPFRLFIYGSKDYDAEIHPGAWCYVEFVHTIKENPHKVKFFADRNYCGIDYKGQEFKINYGERPIKEKE